jgi:hypothetical protein
MSVEHVEVVVEEPSMEEALNCLLPKILGAASFAVYAHQCKDEMLQRLPERLLGYARWLPENWRVVVVLDRDNDDCHRLKDRLEDMAAKAGLATRSRRRGGSYAVINRLAIEELEAWYFGDWEAVRTAYPKVAQTVPAKAQYRDPDAIKGGTWEAFQRVLQKVGYFRGGLRKIEAARSVSPHMQPDRNTSRSFQVFRDALLDLARR